MQRFENKNTTHLVINKCDVIRISQFHVQIITAENTNVSFIFFSVRNSCMDLCQMISFNSVFFLLILLIYNIEFLWAMSHKLFIMWSDEKMRELYIL